MFKALMLILSGITASSVSADYANNIETSLRLNRDAYLSGAHTSSRQKAALDYFDQRFEWLQSPAGCGNQMLGTAGVTCIRERQRQGRWPWEAWYRDPIIRGYY